MTLRKVDDQRWKKFKAGRFLSKAGCYAVVVLADNAAVSLAVNRRGVFCTQAANRSHYSYIFNDWQDFLTWFCPPRHMQSERLILSRFWLRGQLQYHTHSLRKNTPRKILPQKRGYLSTFISISGGVGLHTAHLHQ